MFIVKSEQDESEGSEIWLDSGCSPRIIAACLWQSVLPTLALIRPEERTGRWEKPKDQKDVKTNKERLEYLVKNGKDYSARRLSDAITAQADTPEGAYAKIRELYNSFNLSTLWARDDYQQDKEVNFPLYRFHLMKKLKLI